MKYTELKKVTKNLQSDCSKDVLKEILDTFNINGIKEEIAPNIILLDSDDEDQFNIACSNNDSFYFLNGEYSELSNIIKYQIKEEPNVNIDNKGYKEDYSTVVNVTSYTDRPSEIVVREEQYVEDKSMKEKLKDCSFVARRPKIDKYVIPHELVSNNLYGFDIHMYDYNNWNDPVLKEWYIENFVEYFTNNNLDVKLKNILKENNKVLKKEKNNN
ncbi:MAG: hypothetical protein IJF92_05745 [Bacilli bacterium]|nr:hypothetical protein [Bacilli bacterium]